MDADGEVLAAPTGRSVTAFNSTLTSLEAYLDLKARADGGDKSVANDLFIAELQLGKLDFDDAKIRHGELRGLGTEQVKLIDAAFVNLEVDDIVNRVNTRQIVVEEATKQFAEMAKADRVPTSSFAPSFWSIVLQHAASTEDVKLFERGFSAMKELLGDSSQNAEMLETLEKQLKELKGG